MSIKYKSRRVIIVYTVIVTLTMMLVCLIFNIRLELLIAVSLVGLVGILLVYELYINLKRLFRYSNTNITIEDRKSTLVNLLVSVLIFSLSLCFL